MTSEHSTIPRPVSTTNPANALNVPRAEPANAVPADQMMSTASSLRTYSNDSSKPLLTGYEKTAAMGNRVTVPIEENQINTLYDNQLATLNEGPVVNLNVDQTSFETVQSFSWRTNSHIGVRW